MRWHFGSMHRDDSTVHLSPCRVGCFSLARMGCGYVIIFACQHSMVCGEKMALITGCNIRKHPAASFLTLKLRRDGRATLTLRGPTILTPIPSTEYECVQRWLLRKMTSMQMLSRVVSPSDRNEKAVGIAYQVQYALWCISKAIQLFNRDKALV